MGLFSKPKGWENLSEPGRVWAGTISRGNVAENFIRLMGEDNLPFVRYLDANFRKFRDSETVYAAARAACEHDKPLNLKYLIEVEDYPNKIVGHGEETYQALYQSAINARSLECLEQLQALSHFVSDRNRVSRGRVVDFLVEAQWREGMERCFSRAVSNDGPLLDTALQTAQQQGLPQEIFDYILSWSDKFEGKQGILSIRLKYAAYNGAIAQALALLAKGADPNVDLCQPLYYAVMGAHKEMAKLLIEHGADVQQYGKDILTQLSPEHKNNEAGVLLSRLVEQKRAVQAQAARYVLVSPEAIAEELRLPSGGTLTLLFNFKTRQQILMLKENGQPATPQISGFSQIENQEALEDMGRRLIALGGDPTVVEVEHASFKRLCKL